MNIKIGDKVSLKHQVGSPFLTVTYVRDSGGVSVTWWSKDVQKFEVYSFPAEALVVHNG